MAALVGNVGAIATGTTTVTPAFGQATTAGHLLVARVVFVGNATVATVAVGWVQAIKVANSTAVNVAVWYKPNSGASEIAPTFTVASGTYLAADLSEWSGVATTSPLDQTGTGTGSSTNPFVQNNVADAASGEVQIGVLGTSASKSGTLTFTDGWSPAATPAGSAHGTGATSTTKHAWLTANIGNGGTGFNSVTINTSSTWAMVIATFASPPVAPTTPGTPVIQSAAATGGGGLAQNSDQLFMRWTAPSQGTAIVYDVHRSPNGTTWTTVQTGTTNLYFQDSGLTTNSTYFYYVTARNGAGSADSGTASGTPVVFSRSNSFEGGTVGATFSSSNSGGASGDAFDTTRNAGVYTATAAHGSVAVSLGNNYPMGTWYVPNTAASVFSRVYFQFSGTTFAYNICAFTDAGVTEVVKLWINNGVLGIYDLNGGIWTSPGTPTKTFTTTLSINTWYRLEAQVFASATKPTVRLYAGANLDTTTITETVTPTTGTYYQSQPLDTFTIGGTNSGGTVLIDDAAVSLSTWVGPYSAPTGGGGVVPTQGGTGLRVISKWR